MFPTSNVVVVVVVCCCCYRTIYECIPIPTIGEWMVDGYGRQARTMTTPTTTNQTEQLCRRRTRKRIFSVKFILKF